MKPTVKPSLDRGETNQITPWEIIQREGRLNEQKAGHRQTRRIRQELPRQTLGKKKGNQNTLLHCWGIEEIGNHSKTEMECLKTFGDSKSSKGENLIRCASHNIHNMPISGFGARSKEIALMASGKDSADIRL